ncbi:MAG TPA: hypothetical protein VFN28_11100, partial [Amaricoccus sp.]|nr:hypothetical protein [Amaricoccus sp.]
MKDLSLRTSLAAGLLAILAGTAPAAAETAPPLAAAAPLPRPAPPPPGQAAPGQAAPESAPGSEPESEAGSESEPAPVEAPPDPAAVAVFSLPAAAAEVDLALAQAEAGDLAGAARRLDARIAATPSLPGPRAARAAVAMLAGEPGRALDALEAAADAGLGTLPALLADPLFAPLASDPGLAARAAALAARPAPPPAPEPVPAAVADQTAPISAANTAWNPATGRLEPRFAFAATPPGPILPARPKVAALDILREHARRGRAAGNWGDLYDNRDRGHSRLDLARYPQLAATAYDAAARAAEADYGLQDRFLFHRPTFGNSSTAVTGGALWRSLPRLAMTEADGAGPLRLWQNASHNALYVYPAHKDYGPKSDGVGDLFPANTPYLLISAGSSGSDQPFLDATALALAAFRPDTKAKLVAGNLVVPTVQMVLRRSLRSVTSRALYMSSAAWSAALEPWDINAARMVSLANSIRADAIPPQVRLAVETEDLGTEGVDFFGEGLSEQLFDTPAAVARIWRSRAARRSLVASVAETRDPSGRELAFAWRLLQGDPRHVTIEPLDAAGSRARITLDWTPPFPISKENPIRSARVDVGVFASNGVHDSAPAILSWYMPPSEIRTIETGPDGAPRTARIEHADPAKAATYADPMLVPRADWSDHFTYGEDGALTGWLRSRDGAPDEIFAPDGRRLPEAGSAAPGGPAASPVAYPLARDAEGRLVVRE